MLGAYGPWQKNCVCASLVSGLIIKNIMYCLDPGWRETRSPSQTSICEFFPLPLNKNHSLRSKLTYESKVWNKCGEEGESSYEAHNMKAQMTARSVTRCWISTYCLLAIVSSRFKTWETSTPGLYLVVSKLLLFKVVQEIRTMIVFKRFEKLPAVAAYKKSAKPLPCNNTSAAWGAK